MFVQIFGVRECLVVKVKFIMLREEDREYLKSLSPEERFTSYLLGSIQGQDAECTYRLGDCYTDGEFVKRDENVAFTLYYKAYDYAVLNAEELDIAESCLRLGKCYLAGIGIDENIDFGLARIEKAERLFDKYKSDEAVAHKLLEISELYDKYDEV